MAVIGTASRGIVVYKLEGKPEFVKNVDSPLKYQHRCVSIFRDKKKQSPTGKLEKKKERKRKSHRIIFDINYGLIFVFFFLGFGLGSVEGRVAIHYIQPQSSKDNFTFKCHRQSSTGAMNVQDIYAVCVC